MPTVTVGILVGCGGAESGVAMMRIGSAGR